MDQVYPTHQAQPHGPAAPADVSSSDRGGAARAPPHAAPKSQFPATTALRRGNRAHQETQPGLAHLPVLTMSTLPHLNGGESTSELARRRRPKGENPRLPPNSDLNIPGCSPSPAESNALHLDPKWSSERHRRRAPRRRNRDTRQVQPSDDLF